jgi:chromosome segregation ATPase
LVIGLVAAPKLDQDERLHFTIMEFTLVVMLYTLAMWVLVVWVERKKSLPQLEQERAFRLQAEADWQKLADSTTEEKAALTAQLAAAHQRLAELSTQHQTLADTSKADAEEAEKKLAQLQSDSVAALQKQREAEALLTASNTQTSSLEAALESEKGRVNAMQEALEAKQDLAKQLAQELSSTRNAFADERAAASGREDELRAQLANYEKTAASGQSMIEVVNTELEKTRTAQADLEKDYGTKLSDLQRKLSAADQKSALLQKEIMALVGSGGAADSAEAVTQAEELSKALDRAKAAEKKAADLESQLAQGDAGTRKRLREAEYKICELEYKLAQDGDGKTA